LEDFPSEILKDEYSRPHHDLDVWKRSMKFVRKIYSLTESFPDHEKFGLVQQMRRSATSIPANIAEGAGRRSRKDFGNFLGIAQGSNSELETQLLVSLDLGYSEEDHVLGLLSELNEISKMIIGLQKSLKE
jgi:four helix bundle protein